jgi:hypothetical protein
MSGRCRCGKLTGYVAERQLHNVWRACVMVICGLSLTDGWTGCAGEASVCLWDSDSESEPVRPALADPRASAQRSKDAYLSKGRAPHRVNRRLGPTGAPHQPAQRHDRQRITYGMRRPRIRQIGPVRSRPFRKESPRPVCPLLHIAPVNEPLGCICACTYWTLRVGSFASGKRRRVGDPRAWHLSLLNIVSLTRSRPP